MSKLKIAGAALGLLTSASAFAQDTYHWPAPAAATAANRYYLPMGTPVMLRTRTEVNTKQSKPGDRIYLEVAESVSFRGQVIVPAGAPAVAEVTRSERNGHFGKKGKIELSLRYAETPSGPVRLSGSMGTEGKGAGVWSIGGAALVAWPLAFIHGTGGYIRTGTPVSGYFAEPLRFVSQAEAQDAPSGVQAQADSVRSLPATFDPSVFGATRR